MTNKFQFNILSKINMEVEFILHTKNLDTFLSILLKQKYM